MARPLHLDSVEGVAVLRMDRPPANATGLELRRVLASTLAALASDTAVRVVMLTGMGRFFCAGADIGELGTADNREPPQLRSLIDALEAFPKPLVAAINGIAYGGGLELALGCSHRVAARDARLALPEVKLGLIPGAGGTQRLPRLIGIGPALDMILGGEAVDAAGALSVGLVDAILEEPFGESALAWCADIAGRAVSRRTRRSVPDGPARVAALRCVVAAASGRFEDGLKLEEELVTALIASDESRALRRAFVEKRGGKR
ncbi:MAG: enoyl-CoA hydratase/isomerase family protein [Betaproteobacteria bacterium]